MVVATEYDVGRSDTLMRTIRKEIEPGLSSFLSIGFDGSLRSAYAMGGRQQVARRSEARASQRAGIEQCGGAVALTEVDPAYSLK